MKLHQDKKIKKTTPARRVMRFVLWSFSLLLLLLALAVGFVLLYLVPRWESELPKLNEEYLGETTFVYDRGNHIIGPLPTATKRTIVTLDGISKDVRNGVIATEDKRFYEHDGVDPKGIMRAAWADVQGGREGASTITQQTVRILYHEVNTDYSWRRKVTEALVARQLEKEWSEKSSKKKAKDRILAVYLNRTYFGQGAYGIEAAASTYFNQSAGELTLAQSAFLVGLIQAPSAYDPTVAPQAALERRNHVLGRMYTENYISKKAYKSALKRSAWTQTRKTL